MGRYTLHFTLADTFLINYFRSNTSITREDLEKVVTECVRVKTQKSELRDYLLLRLELRDGVYLDTGFYELSAYLENFDRNFKGKPVTENDTTTETVSAALEPRKKNIRKMSQEKRNDC